MRHLYESGRMTTICGRKMELALGRLVIHGERDEAGGNILAVNITKARKSDCAACRTMYRAGLRERRGI